MAFFIYLFVMAFLGLTCAPGKTVARESFLQRMARSHVRGMDTFGVVPRDSFGTVGLPSVSVRDLPTCATRLSPHAQPSHAPWQVWNSAIAIDSFSVGQELRQRGDVKGTLPRSEHGTVWKKTDSLDAYAVFRYDDIEQQSDEDDGSEVIGLVPKEL